jgi:hypothetical protein
MLDPHTKESRGFGFVNMVTAEQADAAKEGLQGEVIEGRTLSIEKARRSRPRTPTPGKYFGPPKRGKLFVLRAFFQPVADLLCSQMVVAVARPAVETATTTAVAPGEEVTGVAAMTTTTAMAGTTPTTTAVTTVATMAVATTAAAIMAAVVVVAAVVAVTTAVTPVTTTAATVVVAAAVALIAMPTVTAVMIAVVMTAVAEVTTLVATTTVMPTLPATKRPLPVSLASLTPVVVAAALAVAVPTRAGLVKIGTLAGNVSPDKTQKHPPDALMAECSFPLSKIPCSFSQSPLPFAPSLSEIVLMRDLSDGPWASFPFVCSFFLLSRHSKR